MPKKPNELTREEQQGVVEGLVQMLYGNCDTDGNPTWVPNMHVEPAELLSWARHEMVKLDLVPLPGPRV